MIDGLHIGNIRSPTMDNLLWAKCSEGRLEEAREALKAGANPNATDGGWISSTVTSCLMEAARNNHIEVVDLLLSWPGIDVNAKDVEYNTALHWACEGGSVASLGKLLATPGLLLNERNIGGVTPIMRAIRLDSSDGTECVRMMAQVADVDLDIKDSKGRNLKEIANM